MVSIDKRSVANNGRKIYGSVEWITDFKLRASWGKTGFYGNTDPFNQYTLYGGGPGDAFYDIRGTSNSIQQGFRTVRLGNPRTGWQQDIVSNIGFESIFWNGKLSLTVDWYNKRSTGLLFPVSLPALLGDAIPPNVNVGNVKNTGIDILLGSEGKFCKVLELGYDDHFFALCKQSCEAEWTAVYR